MNIIWYGQTYFQINCQKTKSNPVKIIINPLETGENLRIPKLDADILLFSSKNYNKSRIKGQPFIINVPGEYDVKDIFLQGISCGNDLIIYRLEAESINLCYLGNLDNKELLDNGVLEKIGNIDILMISIGNDKGLNSSEALEIIHQIDPRIVIPMYYQTIKQKQGFGEEMDQILKAVSKKSIIDQNKLSIKKKDIPNQGLEVIVLKP